MAINIEKVEEEYAMYITFMDDNLNDLESVLVDRYGEDYKLTYKEDSIDLIENFLEEQLNHFTIELFSREKLLENISTYMGEIVRRKLNGRWDLEREEDVLTFGYPNVTHLDGLPEDGGYIPLEDVYIFKEKREKGFLGGSIRSILYANDSSKW